MFFVLFCFFDDALMAVQPLLGRMVIRRGRKQHRVLLEGNNKTMWLIVHCVAPLWRMIPTLHSWYMRDWRERVWNYSVSSFSKGKQTYLPTHLIVLINEVKKR